MRLIFFDTETGGIDPAKHPITQWAGVAVEAGREIEVLDLKIQAEDHELDQAAKHINGWPGAAKWKELGAIPEANAVKQISKFIDRHKAVPMVSRAGNAYDVAQFAGFNVTFDIDFTRAMFARNMQFFSGHPRGLDVLQLACWHAVKFARDERPAEMKLEAVAIWLGVEVAGRKLHSALDDARISLEVARKLYPQIFNAPRMAENSSGRTARSTLPTGSTTPAELGRDGDASPSKPVRSA